MIGAGASALAASRHLVGQGLRPSIFEAGKTRGGAWVSGGTHPKMWKGLTTNLSKHTCRFSDWPWMDDDSIGTFPSATDMGRYLEGYAHNFLDPTCFQYQCQVTNIEMATTVATTDPPKYRVEWTDLASSVQHSKEFEGVIVATGFFSTPSYPKGLDMTDIMTRDAILHSSEYSSSQGFENEVVAVVGSSFSAMEVAVDVASTAKKVIHIVPRIPWVLPRFVPFPEKDKTATTTTTTILPVDLALYRRTQDAPQVPERIEMTPTMARARHEFLNSIVGRRQANSPLGIPTNWDEPPFVAISDYYLDLIVQGDIQVIHGRFQDKCEEEEDIWEVKSPTGQSITLSDVDKIICATGYQSNLQDILQKDILDILEFDVKNLSSPMVACWDTLHPDLPNFFFCGMYRGPYMGIMEQQGRLAAQILSGALKLDRETMQEGLERSRQMRLQERPQPQFPHFDYVGFLDTLNTLQKQHDFPTTHTQKGDMVVPAFYQPDEGLAKEEYVALQRQIEKGQDGSLIPSVVLSAIIGEWNFDRQIVHFADERQERVYGKVKYSRPTLDHVLYREDGFYELSRTKTLNVFREYEYQVAGDCLELYFVEQGKRAHLFLSLKFSKQERTDSNVWVATSDHLCIQDLYKARFEVMLDGLAATHLRITYRVKGPTKDYESTTILTPHTLIGGKF